MNIRELPYFLRSSICGLEHLNKTYQERKNMITRMEIEYRSIAPCSAKPVIFSTGGYEAEVKGKILRFDFKDMEAQIEHVDGYLHISTLQKSLEESLLGELSAEDVSELLFQAKKEDFREAFYECYEADEEKLPIELEPLEIAFTDNSASGDGIPRIVAGTGFSNLSL